MKEQPAFDTTTAAINWLRAEGFTHDFNLEKDKITGGSLVLAPGDFQIEYTFRFEGATDPGDEEIVYGVSSVKDGTKGVLMSAYGMYSETLTEEMLQKLKPEND